MGTTEIIIIAIVLVILFGRRKVTEWSKGIGEATREVSKLKKDLIEETDPNKDEESSDQLRQGSSEASAEAVADKKALENNEESEEIAEETEEDKTEEREESEPDEEKPKKTAKKSKKKGVDPLPEEKENNVWSKFN